MEFSSYFTILHRLSFWILLAFVSSFVIRFILLLDPNKRVYNHTPGPCRVVTEKYKGTSGLHFVESQNRVYITYGFGKSYGLKGRSGVAYFDIRKAADNQQQQTYDFIEMTINWNGFDSRKFAPSAISSYSSSTGRLLLYVVNEHPEHQCIHFFSVDKTNLNHRKAVCDPMFSSIRGIAVVGADRFFVTNLAHFSKGYLQVGELASQSTFGSVFLYDGHNISSAIGSLSSPSAISFHADRNLLYVASILNEVIKVYNVDKDMSVRHKTDISLLTSPMGMHIDRKTGDIWVACHPVLFQAFLHYQNAVDEKIRSPSQVLRIRFQEDGSSWVITEPYANDGATISTSTGIAYHNEQLLIGSAFGRLLHCDVLNPQIT